MGFGRLTSFVISFELVLSVIRWLMLEVCNVRVSVWAPYDFTINTVVSCNQQHGFDTWASLY